MAELTYCDTWVARSVNSGMSMNWMPIAGRGCTPGLRGSALSIALRVGSANAEACLRYCGFWYVEARSGYLVTPGSPALYQVQAGQHDERHHQQRGRDGRRRGDLVVLDPPPRHQ